MAHDIFGQPTTLSSSQALSDWNAAILAFLAHGATTPQHLGACLTAEPDFALGHAVKGLFTLLLGRREVQPVAVEALETSRRILRDIPVSTRERRFVDALAAWIDDAAPSQSIACLEAVLDDHRDDPLAMKLSHAIRFVLGDGVGMRRSIERVLPAYALDHPARGYVLGCHAFALEETGDYSAAEVAGRQSLWTAPNDAWGLHAVAHVYDMTGNARGGVDWLTGREAAWAHCNNFRYHVWWHKALMHLDLGEVDTVLALYDDQIRAERTDDYRDISNATSLLSRLELEGVNVGNRWEELAEFAAGRTEDGSLIFADLHYMLALVATDRDEAVATMMARMERDAGRNHCELSQRMRDPGLDAARGLEAFGETDYTTAFACLSRARATMQQAGGSHAQRDVFERLTIDAGLRAGYLAEAEAILSDRQRHRGGYEDGYTAARRNMIDAARVAGTTASAVVPAQ